MKCLADKIIFYDELENEIQHILNRNVFYVGNYFDRKYRYYRIQGKPKIVVIEVAGTIIEGDSGMNPLFGDTIGDKNLIKAINRASKDTQVAAIILRVNSPGGSGLASDKILRELIRARKKKPVIVSMGTVAASGGYFISAAGDYIYATPSTVTGSIGAFSLYFSAQELYGKLRLTHATYNRGGSADYTSTWRRLSDEELKTIQRSIDAFYEQFISRVADGRKMSEEKVKEIAGGRVWSGKSAKNIGLVDEMGGFNDALDKARELSGIGKNEQVELVFQPERRLGIGDFVSGVSALLKGQNKNLILNAPAEIHELQKFNRKPLYLAPQKIEIE